MKNVARWCIAGSLMVGILGCATQEPKPAPKPAVKTEAKPAPQPASKPAPKPAAKTEVKPKAPPAPPVSEFEQMVKLCNLQGEQLAAFNAKVDARTKAMNAWQTSADGKKLAELRTAAKEATDDAKRSKLQAQIEPLGKKEWDLRVQQRATVMGVLTLAQQQQWASYVLNNWVLGKGIRKVKFSDDQLKKVQAVCDKAVAKLVQADTIAKDPYLASLKDVQAEVVKEITDKVLTAEQRPKPAQ
jgi:hypothetical protein